MQWMPNNCRPWKRVDGSRGDPDDPHNCTANQLALIWHRLLTLISSLISKLLSVYSPTLVDNTMSSTMLPSDSYFAQQHCFPLKGASSLQLHTLVPSHSLLYRASDALNSSVLPFHGQPVGMGSHLFPVGLGPLELCDEVTVALESCTEDQLGSFIVPDGFGLFNGALDNSTDITLTLPDENAVYCIYSACSIKIRIDERVKCCFAAGDTSFELTATGKETTTRFGFEKEYLYIFRAFFVCTGLTLALLALPNWVTANIHSEIVLKALQSSLMFLTSCKITFWGLTAAAIYLLKLLESQCFISGSYIISAQSCLLPMLQFGYWSCLSLLTFGEFPLSDFLSELGSEAVQSDVMKAPVDNANTGALISFYLCSLVPFVAFIYKNTPFGGVIGHDIAEYVSLVAQKCFYLCWIYLYYYMIHYIWIRSRDTEEKTCKRAVDRSALALAIVPPLLHVIRCLSMMGVQYFYNGRIYWCWNLLNNPVMEESLMNFGDWFLIVKNLPEFSCLTVVWIIALIWTHVHKDHMNRLQDQEKRIKQC